MKVKEKLMEEEAKFTSENLTSVTDTSDGEYVLRTGKIFEAGSYPDKQFDITPEEMLEAINEFKPVDVDLEHMNTVLDGQLGKLETIQIADNGWDLVGTVRLPKWLDTKLGDDNRKVSATWNKSTKKLEKLALVRNPRVADAALMAAFTADEMRKSSNATFSEPDKVLMDTLTKFFETVDFKHRTYEGQSVLQSIHDMAARNGAICEEPKKDDKKSPTANYVSKGEYSVIQKVHDSSISGGARCSAMGDNSYPYFNKSDEPSGNINDKEKKTMKISLAQMFAAIRNLPEEVEIPSDEGTGAGVAAYAAPAVAPAAAAPAVAATPAVDPEKEALKKELDAFKKKEADAVEAAKVADEAAKAEEAANLSALVDEEKEKLKAEIEAYKAKEVAAAKIGVELSATEFADSEIKAKRAFPAERSGLIALFMQATSDDAAVGGTVGFSKDGKDVQGTRLDALKAIYSVRKPHVLTQEEVVGMGAGVLTTEDGDNTDYLAEAREQAKAYAQSRNAKNKK